MSYCLDMAFGKWGGGGGGGGGGVGNEIQLLQQTTAGKMCGRYLRQILLIR